MIFNELQQTPTAMIKEFAAVFLQFRIGAENPDEDEKKKKGLQTVKSFLSSPGFSTPILIFPDVLSRLEVWERAWVPFSCLLLI